MTSLLSAKKRAEEFAAALDKGPAAEGVRLELAELVSLAHQLRREEPPAPRPEFTASLREQLMAEAADSLVQDAALSLRTRRPGKRERRLAVAASAFALVGGSAGMAVAAQQALPGDALYPIKRGIEAAQTGLASDDTVRGRELLEHADERLEEVSKLLADPDDPNTVTQVPLTIGAYRTQAQEGSRLLLGSRTPGGQEQGAEEVRTFTQDGIAQLTVLAEVAPSEQQDELADAAKTLTELDRQARSACPTCAAGRPIVTVPALLVAANEAGDALRAMGRAQVNNDHPVQPEGGYDPSPPKKVPDSTKAKGDTKGDDDPGTTDNGGGDSGPTGDGKGDGGGGDSGDTTTPDGPSLGDVIPDLPGVGGDGGGQKDGDGKGDGTVDPPSGKDGGGLGDTLLPDPLDPILKGLTE